MRRLAAFVLACLLTPLLAVAATAGSTTKDLHVSGAAQALTNPINISVLLGSAGDDGTGQVTSNPAGIDCGTTCSFLFESGSPISLTAEGTNGSTFEGWQSEVCTGQGATCSFDVPPVSIEITALFRGIGPPISQPPPPTPQPSPSMGVPSSPRPSAKASTKPTSRPGATKAPAQTAAPGQTTTPGATEAPGASIELASGPTDTGSGLSLAPMDTPYAADPAAGEGAAPVLLLVLLIGIAAIVIGGGTFFAIKRRGAPPPAT